MFLGIGGILLAKDQVVVGYLALVCALIAFWWAIREKEKEGWGDEYDSQFNPHVPTLHAHLDMAWSKWRERKDWEEQDLPASWRKAAREAEWAFSYDEVKSREGLQLLGFAKAVYVPSMPDRPMLKRESLVADEEFDRFHDLCRRPVAHYLISVGEEAASSRRLAKWAAAKLYRHENLVRMIVYLAMPLRDHTEHEDSVRDTGFEWFVALSAFGKGVEK